MEIISYLILGLIIVVSPGADFVLVFKNSLSSGRKAGLLTALGIGLGTSIHITYSILGISHLLSQSVLLFSVIKYAGAAYLIYLGITGLFSSKLMLDDSKAKPTATSSYKYLIQGFLCNLLNPKTMLFFLSVFSQLVSSSNESNSFVLGYGVYIAMLHVAWFCVVALFVTSENALHVFQRFGHRINQVCGAGLVTFGTTLSLSN
ncbi:LysE family translocator [Vibrio sp. HN007]|uniref:LysE family translocator n=1 Tax=Vibrio iocasae TaxID=3098914 RepID=UPI0035D3EE50